jgi:hypothetical protein
VSVVVAGVGVIKPQPFASISADEITNYVSDRFQSEAAMLLPKPTMSLFMRFSLTLPFRSRHWYPDRGVDLNVEAPNPSPPAPGVPEVPLDQTIAPIDYLQEGLTGDVPLDQTRAETREFLGSEGVPPVRRRLRG